MFRWAREMGVRSRGAGQEGRMPFFYLLDGVGIVVGSHRNIPAVEDCGPAVERIGV